jgi:3-(3-hydroxy-phenyl)propionate hydroxylase
VLLLDEDDTVSIGSRGVCYAKRALEILDRYGVGDAVCAKGVSWNVGRTFFRDKEVYNFNLVPEPDHHRPGMVNLQQYYLEEYLVARAATRPGIELRWKNKVVSVAQGDRASRSRWKPRTACTRSRPTGWSPPTARAARSGACSAWKSRARSSWTAS